jgi:hypothetical protein
MSLNFLSQLSLQDQLTQKQRIVLPVNNIFCTKVESSSYIGDNLCKVDGGILFPR